MAQNFHAVLNFLLELQLPKLEYLYLYCALTVFVISVDPYRLGLVVGLLAFSVLALHAYNSYLDDRMEKTARETVVTLKSSSHSIDYKVTQLTKLKSEIKQRNVPEPALSTVFNATRSAISSPHTSLSSAGFATLNNLLKRLYLQEHYQTIASNGRNFYPLLLERLGDHKESVRSQASQAFTDFWAASPSEVEHQVLETALVGKNAKSKEASINWLLTMTQEHGLLFRTYVPSLVGCLEDADSGVRETAKKTVVELFLNGPPRAKSDLKKELQVQNVRKSIVTSIMSAIDIGESTQSVVALSKPIPAAKVAELNAPLPEKKPDSSAEQQPLISQPVIEATQEVPPDPKDASSPDDDNSSKSKSDTTFEMSSSLQSPSSINTTTEESLEAPESGSAKPVRSGKLGPDLTGSGAASTSVEVQMPPVLVPRAPPAELGEADTADDAQSSTLIEKSRKDSEKGNEASEPKAPEEKALESPDGEKIEPQYVNSRVELDSIFREMVPYFEGKEAEHNWVAREQYIRTIRRLARGNGPQEFAHTFIGGVKSMLDGILKNVTSLRTTVSSGGCYLVQELAKVCGSALDPMIEILLQTLIKLCGALKKISAQNGNTTVDVVLANVTYSSRILQHIWNACQDKNVQPRLYATGWLRTIINKQSRVKSSIEHGGGLDTVEKAIKKGLGDANPGVREGMRSTYWAFAKVWPQKAESIMDGLDQKSKGLLEKSVDNPNYDPPAKQPNLKAKAPTTNLKGRPVSVLKEAIEKQKRAMARNKARPESAQATFPEVKAENEGPRPKSVPPKGRGAATGVGANGSGSTTTSSLSAAPVRPAARPKKPEITRPATAEPYSTRRRPPGGTKSSVASPAASPRKGKAKAEENNVPPSPSAKSKMGFVTSKPKRLDIPRTRPKQPNTSAAIRRQENRVTDIVPMSPTKAEESVTVVVTSPTVNPAEDSMVPSTTELGTQSEEEPQWDRNPSGDTSLPVAGSESLPETVVVNREENPTNMELGTLEEQSEPSSGRTPSQQAPVSIQESVLINPWRVFSELGSNSLPFSVIGSSGNQSKESSGNWAVVSGTGEAPVASGVTDAPSTSNPSNESSGYDFSITSSVVNDANRDCPEEDLIDFDQPTENGNPQNEIPINSSSAYPKIPGNGISNVTASGFPVIETTGPQVIHQPQPRMGAQVRRNVPRDPVKARAMISKGIVRVRAGEIDIFGYRKLQELVLTPGIFPKEDGLYDDLLVALFDELESTKSVQKPDSSVPITDVKVQILFTIKLMFGNYDQYFITYHPRAMTAIIATRKNFPTTSHLSNNLEDIAKVIIRVCRPVEVLEAVLGFLETEEYDPPNTSGLIFGTWVLGALLRRFDQCTFPLPMPEIERLGRFMKDMLAYEDTSVRRVTVEFCSELYTQMNEQKFWTMIKSARADYKSLLAYYVNIRPSEEKKQEF